MGFILKENNTESTYVYCKLTEQGRIKIAQGNFNPTFYSIGDSEYLYGFYNDGEGAVDPLSEDSLILKPVDKFKKIKNPILNNLEGSSRNIYNGLITTTQAYEREVDDIGFFSGTTYNHTLNNSQNYIVQGDIRIDISQLDSNNNKTLEVIKNTTYGSNTNEPSIGDYILVNWSNPYITSNNNFNDGVIDDDALMVFIWYKITNIDGLLSDNTLTLTVDRDLPNFGTGLTTQYSYGAIFPKFNSMEGFYNSIYKSDYWENDVLNFDKNCNTPPLESNIWNLNILYTEDIAGTKNNNKQLKDQESSKYGGFLRYITTPEFNHKNIGIIHYTNYNPSNKYGEKFVDDIFINLPTILWHKNQDNKIGVQFKSDNVLKTFTDGNFTLNYYNLIDDWNNIVGVIFNDLKIITITDQELLYAMSYKSNRNWTLVEHNAQFSDFGCPVDIGDIGTYYYGTYEVLGGNVAIPTENDINISTGIGVNNVNLNDFAITIPFNSGVNDFIWFAIPSAFPLRTEWFVTILNKGLIGGSKIISGNLFPDPVLVNFNNIEYRLYISNYRTNAEFIDVLI